MRRHFNGSSTATNGSRSSDTGVIFLEDIMNRVETIVYLPSPSLSSSRREINHIIASHVRFYN